MWLKSSCFALLCVFFSFYIAGSSAADTSHPRYHHLPPLREQASIINGWRGERLKAIPGLLRKYGVDAWLISQKEYAEDTAFWSMKEATQFSARRRTTSLFLANASDDSTSAYTWIDNTSQLWRDLAAVLEAHGPKSIAVNADADIAFSSGLHAGELARIVQELGDPWADRLVSIPMLAVEYIATMPDARLHWYRKLMETAWAMISDAFSERVVTPGVTMPEDVEWWLRERIQAMNYTTWFHPSVTIVEPGTDPEHFGPGDSRPITYGDVLHVDFGVTALGLNTDTQHLAYVLPPGKDESDVPKGLLHGLHTANRLQDIVRENMAIGRSGNEILAASREQMKDEGGRGKIYCHPIGDWGHSAGTLIGMTNLQDGVPVLGDLPLLKNTYYSVELYAEAFVPEFNASMPFFQEEDVYWDEETQGFEWVYGRQEKFHLIRTPAQEEGYLRVQG